MTNVVFCKGSNTRTLFRNLQKEVSSMKTALNSQPTMAHGLAFRIITPKPNREGSFAPCGYILSIINLNIDGIG